MFRKFMFIFIVALSCQHERLKDNQIKKLTECDISLEKARNNILAKGYDIQFEGKINFSTGFKKSDEETETSLFGELIKEKQRKFVVYELSPKKIRFSIHYNIVHFHRHFATLDNPSYLQEDEALYEDIRKELCSSQQP